jgi:hypothetical protein
MAGAAVSAARAACSRMRTGSRAAGSQERGSGVSAEPGAIPGGPLPGLLLVFLETAVPMWAAAAATWPAERLAGEARAAGEVLARGSDALLGPTCLSAGPEAEWLPVLGTLARTKEQAAAGVAPAGFSCAEVYSEVHTAIAKALALGALRPGGVTWLGRHWCVAPHGTCPGVIPATWLPGQVPLQQAAAGQ